MAAPCISPLRSAGVQASHYLSPSSLTQLLFLCQRSNTSASLPSQAQSSYTLSDEDLEIYEAQIRQFRAARLTAEASLRDSERQITCSPTVPPSSSSVSSELGEHHSDGPSLFPPTPSPLLLPQEDQFDDELVGWGSERRSNRPPTTPLSSSPASSKYRSHGHSLIPPIPSPVLLPQEDEFDDELNGWDSEKHSSSLPTIPPSLPPTPSKHRSYARSLFPPTHSPTLLPQEDEFEDELVGWDSEKHSSRLPTEPPSSLPASSSLDKYRSDGPYLFTPRSSPVILSQENQSDDELVGCSSRLTTIPLPSPPASSDLDKSRSDGPSVFPPRSSPAIFHQEDESDDELDGCSSRPQIIPPSSSPVPSNLDEFQSDGPSLFPPSSSPVLLPQEDESDDELLGWDIAHGYA